MARIAPSKKNAMLYAVVAYWRGEPMYVERQLHKTLGQANVQAKFENRHSDVYTFVPMTFGKALALNVRVRR